MQKALLLLLLLQSIFPLFAPGFAAHTLVKTPDVAQYRAIGDLQPGDEVFSFDTARKTLVKNRVKKVHQSLESCCLLLSLPGENLLVALDHLFFLPGGKDRQDGAWLECKDLSAEKLQTCQSLMKESINGGFCLHKVALPQPCKFYCLELDQPHNFFVSSKDFLVHNFVPLPAIYLGFTVLFGAGEIVFGGFTAAAGIAGLLLATNLVKNRSGNFEFKMPAIPEPPAPPPNLPRPPQPNPPPKKPQKYNQDPPASSVNAQAALNKKLRALENAQKISAKTVHLPDGRIRYHTAESLSNTPGPTRGSAYVTEWDPKTGDVRSWQECYNQSGEVNRVHPKMINGQDVEAQHYPPTGKELAAWNNNQGLKK